MHFLPKPTRAVPVLLASCLSVSAAIAEPVKGEAELGLVTTSGNSDTQTINAKLGLTKETERWTHNADFAALNNASDDETTAEKYSFGWQSDRKLDEVSFLYVIASYEDDRFSGFDYQATLGAGYGYKAINEEKRTLTLEIGPGYRVNALPDGDDEKEVTVRLGEKFRWQFSDNAELEQYAIVETGEENTVSRLGASVKSTLTGTLALKVGVDIKHTEEVPDDRDDTDTETYATVSYSF